MKCFSIAVADIWRIKPYHRKSCCRRQNQNSDSRRKNLFHGKPPLVVANNLKPKEYNFFVGANSRLALSDSDLFLDSIDAFKVW